MHKIRVWDLPVRSFHWTLVMLVIAAVVTQKIGGAAMIWHFRCGYSILTLVLFRIVWGMQGTLYARFSEFRHAPSVIIAYLKSWTSAHQGQQYLGHNPVGGLAVFGFLAILALQAVSGLLSNDANESEGPFAKLVGNQWSDRFTWFHQEIGATLLYVFITTHVAAIAYYAYRKNNLVTPMINGDKWTALGAMPADDSPGNRLMALLILILCAAAVWVIVQV
ncbi:MAG: cytochrome b/b6 domain-containing protein [Herminiimonas sp.]|nr:cytochrome b/b6 domain-containing protein [Herminiimonas sp.]